MTVLHVNLISWLQYLHGRVFDSGHKLSFCYSCNRRIETEISQATVTSEVLNEFFIMFIHLQLYNTKSKHELIIVDHVTSRFPRCSRSRMSFSHRPKRLKRGDFVILGDTIFLLGLVYIETVTNTKTFKSR